MTRTIDWNEVLLFVGIAAGLIIAVGVFVVLFTEVGRSSRETGPAVEMAEKWLTDIARGDHASAHAVLSTEARARIDGERFRRAVAANDYLTKFESLTIREREFTERAVRLSGYVDTGAGQVEVVFHFGRESVGTESRLAIVGVTLAGSAVLPFDETR